MLILIFIGACSPNFISAMIVIALIILSSSTQSSYAQRGRSLEIFQAEIFLNTDELTSGLYEGTVKGRRLFSGSAQPHGQGTIYYFSNDKFHRVNYTGEWVNGTRHGNGTTHFKDGSIFRGEYKNGVEEGLGTITYADGNVLEGEFSDGKIHGHAVFRYPNGDQREGFFRENVLDGQVIFTQANGRIVIELWENGKRQLDQEQVVQEGQTSSVLTTTLRPPPGTSTTGTTSRTTTTVAVTQTTAATIDLTQLRNAIRSGDKTRVFFKSDDIRDRRPKVDDEKNNIEMAKRLRTETDQRNQDFLFTVFQRVNGHNGR